MVFLITYSIVLEYPDFVKDVTWMEDLVYEEHKNKLQHIFRGNHLIYLQFIQNIF